MRVSAWRHVSFLVWASVGAASCASPTSPGATGGYSLELKYCVDEINRLRATVGRPPLQRSVALEAFALTAAERDGTLHTAHYHFRATNGDGIAAAETEILWWRGFSVKLVVQKGLAQMWDVGPGGEHYDIIAGAYTEVGCGVFVNGEEVTAAQDFR